MKWNTPIIINITAANIEYPTAHALRSLITLSCLS
jgi:hypothetical protein